MPTPESRDTNKPLSIDITIYTFQSKLHRLLQ